MMDKPTIKPTDAYSFVKLFTKGWLTGGIRTQLTPAERGVWADLLCMASESRVRGIVCRSKGIGYSRDRLATTLDISLELLNSTIEKCLADKNADDDIYRLSIEPDGCGGELIVIGNWDKYQHYDGVPKKRKGETAQERELREERLALQYIRLHPDKVQYKVMKVVTVSAQGEVIKEVMLPAVKGEL